MVYIQYNIYTYSLHKLYVHLTTLYINWTCKWFSASLTFSKVGMKFLKSWFKGSILLSGCMILASLAIILTGTALRKFTFRIFFYWHIYFSYIYICIIYIYIYIYIIYILYIYAWIYTSTHIVWRSFYFLSINKPPNIAIPCFYLFLEPLLLMILYFFDNITPTNAK